MKYMDRRLLFPIAAVTAWAQQPSPEAAQAEAALRARATQFFQLQVGKKFRQAEAMVADDTKDTYYDGKKFNIESFEIQNVELLSGNTKAKVTIKAKVKLIVPAVAQVVTVDAPSITTWKVENGEWMYYVEQADFIETPFGKIKTHPTLGAPSPLASMPGRAPDVATLRSQVKIDRTSAELSSENPRQTLTISNESSGPVDLALTGDHIEGLAVEIEKSHLNAGEVSKIQIELKGGSPQPQTVRIIVSPFNSELDVQVSVR
jgi:hypothetical protein